MQLTNEQRLFINNVYVERKSLKEVQNEFEQRFPERSSPTKKTVWKTVNKFRTHGAISNLNKGNSGRLETVGTNENIERLRHWPVIGALGNGMEHHFKNQRQVSRLLRSTDSSNWWLPSEISARNIF
ncbi:Protein of unknown function DUF4817 [Trinorchestia longiramus]|nr:Protein of unknown function DUF4817 [Trinorchestia longiramus]